MYRGIHMSQYVSIYMLGAKGLLKNALRVQFQTHDYLPVHTCCGMEKSSFLQFLKEASCLPSSSLQWNRMVWKLYPTTIYLRSAMLKIVPLRGY